MIRYARWINLTPVGTFAKEAIFTFQAAICLWRLLQTDRSSYSPDGTAQLLSPGKIKGRRFDRSLAEEWNQSAPKYRIGVGIWRSTGQPIQGVFIASCRIDHQHTISSYAGSAQ